LSPWRWLLCALLVACFGHAAALELTPEERAWIALPGPVRVAVAPPTGVSEPCYRVLPDSSKAGSPPPSATPMWSTATSTRATPARCGSQGSWRTATARPDLRCRDRSCCLEPPDFDLLVEPYALGAAGRRGVRGGGLGLAFARQIVHAMGGRIEARPGPKQGSRVGVELPLEIAA
jgi:hypothetical protein